MILTKRVFIPLLSIVTLSFAAPQPPPSIVGVTKVVYETFSQKQHFNGNLEFNQKARLAAQSSGAITAVYFDKTDFVKKGQLLLDIDDEMLQASVEAAKSDLKQAELKLELAQRDHKRYAQLLAKKTISQRKYETTFFLKQQSEQSVLSLRAQLKAAKVSLARKHLYASFDGVIVSRDVAVGEWLKEGDLVALVVNPNKIDIVFHLPETYIDSVRVGSIQRLTINNKHYKAKVIGKVLGGDINTRTFPLFLRLTSKKGNFFEGMQVGMDLETDRANKYLIIPRDAIVRKYGKSVIYIADKGQAQLLSVSIIKSEGQRVAVSSAKLKAGMKVIVKGNERLYPAAKIIIQ